VNQVYALTIASTNANVGNVASNGFWLQSGTGDARFGGNVSIGANLNVEGLITIGTLNANTVGGGQIVPGSITGNLVAANTIYGNSIVANSFEANTINGGAITAGTISANAFVAGTITAANSIQSSNATFNSPTSAGYWLNSNTGDVRFAGNTSVGNNLTVGNNASIGGNLTIFGLALQGTLVGNSVSTTNLVPNAVTQQITYQLENGTQIVNILANSAVRGYWPTSTRGIALNGVISPTLNGGTAYNNSRITVTYNTTIYSDVNNEYNVVELWKANTSAFPTQPVTNYYVNGFRKVKTLYTTTGSPTSDWYTVVGINGSFTPNVANLSVVTTSYTADYYDTIGTRNNTASNTVYRIGQTISPRFQAYDSVYTGWSSNSAIRNLVTVGSQGSIISSLDTNVFIGSADTIQSGGYGNDLYAIASTPIAPTVGAGLVTLHTVGSNGTILKATKTYDVNGTLTSSTGWFNASQLLGSSTIYATNNDLFGVASNGLSGANQVWVAVGENDPWEDKNE
jgi:hypothetical protein